MAVLGEVIIPSYEDVKPRAGDTKIVQGVVYIRQYQLYKTYNNIVFKNGDPVYEWVIKDSNYDRMRNKHE